MPYAERNGIRLYYESFGEGKPIVFLHPLTTNRYIWANQIFVLARDYRVVVVDHRGHGLSDKPAKGYAIPEFAADLIAVLDAAEIEKAVLVGNSIGGMIALQASLDAPGRVEANFIISSGTNFAPSIPTEVVPAYTDSFETTYDHILEGGTSAKTKRDRSEVCDFLASVYRVQDNFTRAVFLATITDPEGVFHWNITDQLKDIHQPTIVLAGEEDKTIPPGACQLLADKIPGAQLKRIGDVGHFYQIERPDDFNNDLIGFLRQLGSAHK